MSLPKMDVPIGVVQWEVFVPEQYRARAIDGNMIDANKFPAVGFGLSAGDEVINTSRSMTVQENVTVSGAGRVDERQEPPMVAPSQNVVNLQQRAAGVLPIRVEVPRAGVSHQFIKPLVVGSEATVKLRYKRN